MIQNIHTGIIFRPYFQVPTSTRPQFCKLLCQDGQWRGPYCGDDPHGVKGDEKMEFNE